MAKCAYCGTETKLHINGVPVCIECDNLAGRVPIVKQPPEKVGGTAVGSYHKPPIDRC